VLSFSKHVTAVDPALANNFPSFYDKEFNLASYSQYFHTLAKYVNRAKHIFPSDMRHGGSVQVDPTVLTSMPGGGWLFNDTPRKLYPREEAWYPLE
jgi:hypothetical protein